MDPEKKSLNFIFPTKYVIPKSLKFSHWLSEVKKDDNKIDTIKVPKFQTPPESIEAKKSMVLLFFSYWWKKSCTTRDV